MPGYLFLITVLISGSVAFGGSPTRIVSTSLASDEVIIKLMVGPDRNRIAAVSPLASDARYSHLTASDIQGLAVFDSALESFVALKPDLVLMASFNKVAIQDYVKKHHIRHLMMDEFSTLADVKRNVLRIATAIGQRKKGRELLKDFSRRVERVESSRDKRSKKQKPTVLTLDTGFSTMGEKTLFHDIVKTVGGVNLAKTWGIDAWGKVSVEKILADSPDIIVLSHQGGKIEQEYDWLFKSPLYAFRNPSLLKRICPIRMSSLLSTSQYIVDAVEELDKCVGKWLE